MVKKLTAAQFNEAAQLVEAMAVNARNDRYGIVSRASRMIDILRGVEESTGVGVVFDDTMRRFESAPSAIPRMRWTGGTSGGEGMTLGNLGGLYADRFGDQRPSDTFNTGFYAGVLAAREALVDVESFTHDSVVPETDKWRCSSA